MAGRKMKLRLTCFCRKNLEDAAQSDRTLEALVDDNQEAFAALGLGKLPGSSAALLVRNCVSFHLWQLDITRTVLLTCREECMLAGMERGFRALQQQH